MTALQDDLHRAYVHDVIDGECAYQVEKWGERSNASITEFLAFTLDYVMEGLKQVTRDQDGNGNELALHTMRKIAGLSFSCMEQHGALPRVQLIPLQPGPKPYHTSETGGQQPFFEDEPPEFGLNDAA